MGKFVSGFVAIIGRPNVGKSTFINYVLGKKISIISPKAQTTRNTIQGIYTTLNEQIIFIDTPGIHKPQHKLGEYMNKSAINTLKDVDLIIWLIDGASGFGKGDEYILSILENVETKCFAIINKIDLIKNNKDIIEIKDQLEKKFNKKDIYEISALTGENVNSLLSGLSNNLDEGPMYYPLEQITDHPESFIIGEIIREKVLLLTREEIPHSVAVIIEDMKLDEANLMSIHATIYVERQSQKKIIIGKGGEMMKKIGTLARKDIVMLIGNKVYLEIWVKVEEDWRNRQHDLKMMGYFLEK